MSWKTHKPIIFLFLNYKIYEFLQFSKFRDILPKFFTKFSKYPTVTKTQNNIWIVDCLLVILLVYFALVSRPVECKGPKDYQRCENLIEAAKSIVFKRINDSNYWFSTVLSCHVSLAINALEWHSILSIIMIF